MSFLKRIASKLPIGWQHEIQRFRYRRQIRTNTFFYTEPEVPLLPELVKSGDWVMDVGANVGHYAKRLSELVGPTGRVFAFEPVPATFALLTSNARVFAHQNTTLINAAISDERRSVGISVPLNVSGLADYYMAKLSPSENSTHTVYTLPLDVFLSDQRISLIKIDVEGHEVAALSGMKNLIMRHKPVLIIETESDSFVEDVKSLGYDAERLPDSPNVLFRPTVVS